ncbi:hypothetical protein A4S06_00735 [Erysipelotrichaceae bacterium MTC7]|nr:hypothetical protein A4S06_00735 [Erysipelotrichaceae bacterium MTC7]
MTYKHSKQRDMIMEFMQSMPGHASAEQIYEGMNQAGLKISLATIYRNLGILSDIQQVRKIPIDGDRFVYDKTSEPHYHFFCEKCHNLYDLEAPFDPEYQNQFTHDQVVGNIHSHEVVVKGVCKDCLDK